MKNALYWRRVGRNFGLLVSTLWVCNLAEAATLVWDPNPPNEAVTHYTVYIDPVPVGFTPVNVTTNRFPINLPAGINFTLRVTASSLAGESLPSSISYFLPLPPQITLHPESKLIAANDPLELSVEVSGSQPFDFQWMRDGIPLPGQTNQTLLIASAITAIGGNYSVVVTNAAGSVMSEPAAIIVLDRPGILSQPSPVTALPGGPFAIGVAATGSAPLSYQWFRNGEPISGAQSAIYAVLSATSAHAGNYFVQVTNLVGSAQSQAVTVTVQAPPVIITQPQSATVPIGGSVTLTVSAGGDGVLEYQWLKDGQPISGERNIYLVVSLQGDSDFGRYSVRVSNAIGSTESEAAIIQKGVPPGMQLQPKSIDVLVGTSFALSLDAQGTAPLAFQWFRDGVAVSGANAASLNVASAGAAHAGNYFAIITNEFGLVQSETAAVRVIPHIVINRGPTDTNIVRGGDLRLFVEAGSVLPLAYQWWRDDVELELQTNAVLHIPNVSDSHGGSYHVVIRNTVEEIASAHAEVNVVAEPVASAGRLSASLTGGGLLLIGQGVAGASYEVQRADNLENPSWTTIQPSIAADGNGRFEVLIPVGERQGFIRTVRR